MIGLYYLGITRGYDGFSHSLGFVILLGVHSVSLLMFSIYLLSYGYHIKNKITPTKSNSSSRTLSTYSPEYLTRILETVHRINTIMFICITCYLFRVSIMFLKIYTVSSDNHGIIPHLTILVWFLITDILPVLPPVSDYLIFFYHHHCEIILIIFIN